MNTIGRSFSFGPGPLRAGNRLAGQPCAGRPARAFLPTLALAAIATVASLGLAPLANATPQQDFDNNCGSAGGCHASPPEGPRFNAASASNIILQANANHSMGVGALSAALLNSIAGYIGTPGTVAAPAVGYRTSGNSIAVTSLYIDNVNGAFDSGPAITGTANGTLGAGSGSVGHPAVAIPAAGSVSNPNVTYTHTGTTCATDSFDVVGTTASNGNTTNRRVSVPITVPTVTANPVTAGAIAYNTAATTINISGAISVSGVGSLPTGTLQLSGQTGVGTTAATGATTLTYAATGTTYSASVTVNYVAQGPCGTNSGAARTITIPVTAPPPPTGGNLGPIIVPAGAGTTTNIDVSGVLGGFRTANPLTVIAQPAVGEGTVAATGPAQFTYTASGFTGTTTFTYNVTGPAGGVSATYTVTLSPTSAPVVSPASATTAFNTAIAINLSGSISGSSTSVTPSGAVNGTALATGPTTITFTPTAGFIGTGSFQFTATGPGGTSPSPATVTVTVNPPPPTVAPTSATIPFNSGNPVTSTPIDLAPFITGVVASVSATGAVNGTTSVAGTVVTFTPTLNYFGPASFNYTATNAGGTSAPATVSLTVSPPPPPTAAAVSVLVSATAPTTFDLAPSISGSYTTVSIVAAPIAGSATLSGSMLTYTPLAGFSGSTTFTYRATGLGGSSAPATITVTYTAAPVTADRSMVVPYNASGSIDLTSAFAGIITSYSITRQPAHGTLAVNSTFVTYTPFLGYFGADSFQYTAVGPGGSSSPGTVSVTVNPPIATVTGLDVTVPFNSPATIDLTQAISGVATGFILSTPPAHGTVVISGTTATYTPAQGYSGADSFAVIAVNGTGRSQPGNINVTVGTLKPSAAAATLTVPVNSSGTIDLAPFISGSGVSGVSITGLPAHGITDVDGTKVTYTPRTDFFGSDTFEYIAFGNAGKSTPAIVRVVISGRPDPSKDAAVAGLLDSQAQTARRFARAQITNFQRRMESIHVPAPAARPANDSPGTQSGSAPAAAPPMTGNGLQARAAADPRRGPPVARPASLFETSLANLLVSSATSRSLNLSASTDGAGRAPLPLDGLNFWVGGTASFGTRSLGDDSATLRFSTDGISVGADRRLSDRLALGVGLGFARDRADILDDGTNNRARGTSVAGYGSFHPSPRTFVDALLGFGTLTFDSERWVSGFEEFATARRKGNQYFASVAAGYEYRRGSTLVSPYGRLDLTEDRLKRATESGAGPAALAFDEQTLRTTSAAAGVRFETVHETDYGRVAPRARVEFRHDFEGSRAASFSYADQFDGLKYSVTPAGSSRNSLLVGIGSDFLLAKGWKVGVDYQGERSSGPGTVQSVRFLVSKDLDGKGFPAWSGWSMPLAIPVNVDFGVSWDSNIARGRLDEEIRSDRLYTLNIGQTHEYPVGAHARVLATPFFSVDKPHTYTGLGHYAAGAQAEIQYRASGDFDAITFALYGRGLYDKFESNLRTGPRYTLGVNARTALTDRIDLFADVSQIRRYGRSAVFETKETAARFNLDYSLGKTGTAYLSGEYRKGDAFSTGFASLTNIAIADVATRDDAFDGGEFFAYRFDAKTVLGTVGLNMPLGSRDAVDLSFRRVQTTPTLRGAFDDGGRARYIVNQYSLLYLLRF